MKDLSKEEKPIFGQKVNQLKQDLSKMIEEKKEQLAALEMQKRSNLKNRYYITWS